MWRNDELFPGSRKLQFDKEANMRDVMQCCVVAMGFRITSPDKPASEFTAENKSHALRKSASLCGYIDGMEHQDSEASAWQIFRVQCISGVHAKQIAMKRQVQWI